MGGCQEISEVKALPKMAGSWGEQMSLGRVLVVDDEETVCKTLALIFEGYDYEVRQVHSAENALEVVSAWIPDLAIVDVNLGKMNGVELARHILSGDLNCRVLLFSGRPESEDLMNNLAKQGYKFNVAAKPVHPRVLREWARSGTITEGEHLKW